eukprot:2149991-Prymnesium_polylepis.1
MGSTPAARARGHEGGTRELAVAARDGCTWPSTVGITDLPSVVPALASCIILQNAGGERERTKLSARRFLP